MRYVHSLPLPWKLLWNVLWMLQIEPQVWQNSLCQPFKPAFAAGVLMMSKHAPYRGISLGFGADPVLTSASKSPGKCLLPRSEISLSLKEDTSDLSVRSQRLCNHQDSSVWLLTQQDCRYDDRTMTFTLPAHAFLLGL